MSMSADLPEQLLASLETGADGIKDIDAPAAAADHQPAAYLNPKFADQLNRLVRDGFDLLKDLTGPSPNSFDGLYQGWYTKALPAVVSLAPTRLDEFQSLYRWPSRRRFDLETYGIRDYLLGMSLHGGFGGIDVTRGIIARRFHQQLLILNNAQHELASMIGRIEIEIAASVAARQIELAKKAIAAGDCRTSTLLVATAIEPVLSEIARRHRIQPKSGNQKIATLIGKLSASGIIAPGLMAELVEAAEKAARAIKAGGIDDPDQCQRLIDLTGGMIDTITQHTTEPAEVPQPDDPILVIE